MLGAGSWGTALGSLLAGKDWDVRMWDIDVDTLEAITYKHENTRYLPGLPLPPTQVGEPDLERAMDRTDLVVMAVPSFALRGVTEQIRDLLPVGSPLCSVTKGVEVDTLMTMHEVMQHVLDERHHPYLACLSGPSFAIEVARGLPTAVTVAAATEDMATTVQGAFYTTTFRPYTSTDIMGVEIGGCTKNVLAIATGYAAGLGFAANSAATLMTRGLAETTALGIRRGARPETLQGLSGVGDLVLTCTSVKSRNYRVGFGLGQGRSLEEIKAELGQVAEGVVNAKSVHRMAGLYNVDMPISETVYRLLYDGLPAKRVLASFLGRA